jgi:hypothetical protein
MRLFLLVLILPLYIYGQDGQDGAKFQEEYKLKLLRIKEPIKIDGVLEESTWKMADKAKDFWEKWPQDKQRAKRKTEVLASYDDKNIYFAVTCYDTTRNHLVQTLKRDTRFWDGDGFAIFLDPTNQRATGFFFGVTPLNTQHEDLITPYMDDMSFSWDNRWFSETKIYDDCWTAEIMIPFKTLRFSADTKTWGVNFIRGDAKNNQFHTWTHVPVQFDGVDFGYTGALIWDEVPKAPKGNVSIIPFVTGGVTNDGKTTKGSFDAGLDAKVAVTSALNLDLTLNPDFSQIEVDVQQTNLTRFNLFFPERRTFFLENADIFSGYGSPPFRPFFSRTIGLDANGNTVPIQFGARLSGNLTSKLRIGVMNMQTSDVGKVGDNNRASGQNFSAISLIQRIGSRSMMKGYVLNKQATSLTTIEIQQNPLSEYGRNWGLELNLSDASGVWNGWGGYHKSIKPLTTGNDVVWQFGGGYFGRNFDFFADWFSMGKNYYADMGFLNRIDNFVKKGSSYDSEDLYVRIGYSQVFSEMNYYIRPSKGAIIAHQIGTETFLAWNEGGALGERFNRLRYFIDFRNTSSLRFRFDPQMVKLLFYTPLPEDKPLPPGDYTYNQYNIQYTSDVRKKLTFEGSVRWGGIYNGDLTQFRFSANYRVQPWGNFTLGFEQNRLAFPNGLGTNNLFLINPRVEVNFSNNLFWTTFFQFNTQRNNFNINSRLQWRYKPMSDFYLVYTDNYFTNPFLENKNRALVFKFNYWLTL